MANMAMNAFKPGAFKGTVDLRQGGSIVSAQIDVTSTIGEVTGLVAGTPVKLVNSAGGIPKVIECDADTDDVFGFIVYDVKASKYLRLDRCEILTGRGGVMYMEANAAIARNAKIALLISGFKVITATATDRIIGRSFDKPIAQGEMFRVTVDLPGEILPSTIAALGLTANVTYLASDVQSVADKLDAVIALLKVGGSIS